MLCFWSCTLPVPLSNSYHKSTSYCILAPHPRVSGDALHCAPSPNATGDVFLWKLASVNVPSFTWWPLTGLYCVCHRYCNTSVPALPLLALFIKGISINNPLAPVRNHYWWWIVGWLHLPFIATIGRWKKLFHSWVVGWKPKTSVWKTDTKRKYIILIYSMYT